MLELLSEFPEQREYFLSTHGVLPVMQMLEVKSLSAMPRFVRPFSQ
jgi:hypothetical protein